MPSARRAPLALLTALALVLGLAVSPSQAPAAQASTTVPVTVTVLDPDGEPFNWESPGEQLYVELRGVPAFSSTVVVVGPDGSGTAQVAPGQYQIAVQYVGRQNVLNGWGLGFSTQSGSTVYAVTAEGPNQLSAQLRAGGSITGLLTGDEFELDSASFQLYPPGGTASVSGYSAWYEPETQRFTITRLQPGTYFGLLTGWASGRPSLVREWFGGVMDSPLLEYSIFWGSPDRAGQSVTVGSGSIVEVPAMSLEVRSTLSGTVTWPGTSPGIYERTATAYLDGTRVGDVDVNSAGRFTIYDVARFSGEEWVICIDSSYKANSYQWAESCWSEDGTAHRSEAGSITAVPKGAVTGLDIDVVEGTRIFVTTYTDLDGVGGQAPSFATSVESLLYRLSADGEWLEPAQPGIVKQGQSSTWHITAPLLPGTYAIQVVDEANPIVGRTWLTPSGSTTIDVSEQNFFVVADGGTIAVDAILRPYTRSFDRIFGSDRFSTAVAVSRETIGDDQTPASVVYIANGLNYPDALSAGPIAAQQGGAMLMVGPTTIPASVRTELQRLAPERIVIVGGTGAVSAAVEADLRQYVEGDASRVTRVSGADRYVVSRSLIGQSFAGQTGMTLFIATGRNYPDALAAGPAAAALGGAVLLVNGSATTIDTPTRQLIDALQPSEIIIVGGSGVVSNGIASSLVARYGQNNVFRVPGTDRYMGAANLNTAVFGESTLAFVATGTSFADALAGGVLAGQLSAPLYLTLPQCIPTVTHEAMNATRSSFAVIFGGTGAVSTAVERGTVCGARSSDATASIPAPGSRAERQADAEIERLREALDRG